MLYFKLMLLCSSGLSVLAQNSINDAIKKYNSGSIPYIHADELKTQLEKNDSLILFDTRSFKEYQVSYLKNAVWIGYKKFNEDNVKNIDKNAEIIVYCSVGVRSEKIGEELKALGFANIKNLYGGIFSWINKGYPVYKDGKQTEKIHTYNKRWEKYITTGKKVN